MIIAEKSFIKSYKVFPISFPLIVDIHNPRINARSTAANVSSIGVTERLRYGATEIPAVFAILSNAFGSIKLINRLFATKKDTEPAIKVEA